MTLFPMFPRCSHAVPGTELTTMFPVPSHYSKWEQGIGSVQTPERLTMFLGDMAP